MPRKNINISKEELYNLYWNSSLSPYDIGKLYNCYPSTIRRKLKKFNIKSRTLKEAKILAAKYGEQSPNYKGGKPKCIDCGKELSHYNNIRCRECSFKYYIGENHPFFGKSHKKTSKKKMSEWKKENYLGKNNPNYGRGLFGKDNGRYIDGRTSLTKLIRHLEEYFIWIAKVFERDNYICQVCGCYSSGKLEAHHKNPFAVIFSEFLKEYDQFSPIEDKETLVRLAIKYEPFWDITNGQTLCEYCHNLKRKETFSKIKKSGD